jgi:hypothetical protein
VALALSAVAPLVAQEPSASGQGEAPQERFGGGYSSLLPEQKLLVDDWFKRFSAAVKKPVNPEEGYDNLPLSVRTTYSAVTHALLKTKLTDAAGKSLASSGIEVIEKVDTVAGEILGAGGDQQYRIYVEVKPGAMELLTQSTEFTRRRDNGVFHEGYPICFRSPGVPSIQVSLSRDASRANIDVDYRSSKFPAAIVNGHLAASNSDVRAGDNYTRHTDYWAGLPNFWRNLLGLPLVESPAAAGQGIPDQPERKDKRPSVAIFGFLDTWLVKQKPNESIPYFTQDAFDCMGLYTGSQVDRGVEKFTMLESMISANKRIGKVASLGEVSTGVLLKNERLKVIPHPHSSEFALYDVREDLAEEFRCVNRLDSAKVPVKAMKSKAFGKYVGAVFRLKTTNQAGNVIATLWQKQHGYWKLISFEVDPQLDRSNAPAVSVALPAVAPLEIVDGDKDMLKAASDFLTLWIVKKDFDKALQYLTPACIACVNLYRPDDSPAASTAGQEREMLKQALVRVADDAGAVKNLNDAIVAAQPHDPLMKRVKHGGDRAFVVVSVPESMGDQAMCADRKTGDKPVFRPVAAVGYGKYYVSGFSMNEGKSTAGVLWIYWSKVNGSWKAVSYEVLTP